jgi:multiple sugar transport system ATP-binding protein
VPVGGRAAPGQAVTLGIRPEALRVTPDGELSGKVALVERLGGLTLLYVALDGGGTVVVQIEGSFAARQDDAVRLSVDGRLCHVFDAEGLAIARRTLPPLAA